MRDPAIERLFKEAISAAQIPPLPPPPPPPPEDRGGGQGSSIPPMEQRLSAVEQAIGRIDGRLDRMSGDIGHIDREVTQTKWWVAGSTLTIILAMVATVVGTGIAIQQMTVATFQAGAQQQKDAQSAVQSPPAAAAARPEAVPSTPR